MKFIYYSSFTENLNTDIKNIIESNNDTCEYEIDFGSLLNNSIVDADVLILSYKEYIQSYKHLSIFGENSKFYVPMVIILGNITPEKGLMDAPNNYCYCKINEFYDRIAFIKDNVVAVENQLKSTPVKTITTLEIITKTLQDLGFKSGINGTTYLKESIDYIIALECKPVVLSTQLFKKLSERHNTTVDCITRLVKVAIDTAWKNRRKSKVITYLGISFDYFTNCPTTKEFMYYMANRIFDFMRKSDCKDKIMQS